MGLGRLANRDAVAGLTPTRWRPAGDWPSAGSAGPRRAGGLPRSRGARRDFLRLLGDLNAGSGQTILLSSHICSDVERICSDVAILHEGRIVVHSGLDELKDDLRGVRGLPKEHFGDDAVASGDDRVWVRNWHAHDLSRAGPCGRDDAGRVLPGCDFVNRVRRLIRTLGTCFWPSLRTKGRWRRLLRVPGLACGLGNRAARHDQLSLSVPRRSGTRRVARCPHRYGAELDRRGSDTRVSCGGVWCSACGLAALGIAAIAAHWLVWRVRRCAAAVVRWHGALSVFLVCGVASPVLGFSLIRRCVRRVNARVRLWGCDAWPMGASELATTWTALATILSWGLFTALLRRPLPLRGSSLPIFAALRLPVPRQIWATIGAPSRPVGRPVGRGLRVCAPSPRRGVEGHSVIARDRLGVCALRIGWRIHIFSPRGPLPSASWLLLFGANGSRAQASVAGC